MKIRVGALKNLIEAAVDPGTASKSGLAIAIIESSGGDMRVIAYDPYMMSMDTIEDLKKNPDQLTSDALEKNGMDSIVGVVSMGQSKGSDGPCYNAYIIKSTAARKGYGPMIYDLALSLGKPVIPDRKIVSKYAQNVWRVYKDSRGDVVKLPLDDKDNPVTPSGEDDCKIYPESKKGENEGMKDRLSKLLKKVTGGEEEPLEPKNPLNYAYEAGSKAKYSSLLSNHERAVPFFNEELKKIGQKPITDYDWEHALVMNAINYFLIKYKSEVVLGSG